ncbi:hypothetical protein BUTYVIB_02180 [Eshraghiella crossota DSM 2876]|uniref:Uncharacterized protein n=1 Tax=Eshraghiella crossota DSM 2876 TaxID=511680 RepID=D4S258_9FIRM|nr:hypothetical protein BUTYVIB_02180 [Butyrivibrio crossotus DSM 2876]
MQALFIAKKDTKLRNLLSYFLYKLHYAAGSEAHYVRFRL